MRATPPVQPQPPQPVAGVAIAGLWLHEPLHLGQLWGCLAIVAGMVLGLSRQIKTA